MRRFLIGFDSKRVRSTHRRGKNTTRCCVSLLQAWFCVSLSLVLSLVLSLSLCVCVFMGCVKFLLRIANRVGEDSRCRGGIVHIRGGCSCARSVPPKSPKALWRFRVSTSNSPSGRSRLHTNTQIRHIYHTYAQQDIRVCEDDHFQPPNWQFPNPKALWLLRVSI